MGISRETTPSPHHQKLRVAIEKFNQPLKNLSPCFFLGEHCYATYAGALSPRRWKTEGTQHWGSPLNGDPWAVRKHLFGTQAVPLQERQSTSFAWSMQQSGRTKQPKGGLHFICLWQSSSNRSRGSKYHRDLRTWGDVGDCLKLMDDSIN